MTPLAKLVHVEWKLLRRDPMLLFFGLLFPAALLLVVGAGLPGFRDPIPGMDGLRPVDGYAPIMLMFALTILAISALPASLASYRQQGVLRRLSTTPVPSSRLLVAHLVVHLVMGAFAAVLAIAAGVLAFGIDLPVRPLWFAVAFMLTGASLLAVGLLVGALVPSSSAAQIVGTVLWIPLMFLAGLWFPRDEMPDVLRTTSDLTPAGAGVQAMQDAWFTSAPGPGDLAVLVVTGLLFGCVAAVSFRWNREGAG